MKRSRSCEGRQQVGGVYRSSSFLSPLTNRQFQQSAMAAWSRLPDDLIYVIANRLHAVEDFLAFSAVCRSWRSVYLNKSLISGSRVPWLMLNEYDNGECIRGFFSLYKNKVHKLPLPEAHGRQCWGSSHGWLVTIGHDLKIHLLNPITRVQINLPPQSTFENQVLVKLDWFNFIHKATVFKIRDEFVTMAIYGSSNSLAFARLGDNSWTTVRISKCFLFINVICFKDQILALSMVGTLVLVEIDGPNPPRAIYVASPPKDESGWQQIYLLESFDDLLMVFSYKHKTNKFRVYKFDFNAREWVILKSLGDRVLFVDDSYCTSVSSCDIVGCKGNNIYFAEDNLEWLLTGNKKYSGHCMRVYDMENKTTETFGFWEDCPSQYTCPVWLMPSLR